jgi:integrase
MDIPAHLLQRPSGFYFRLVIPKSLRAHYGKTEIRRSLRTASRYVAAKRAMRLWSHFQSEFEGLGMANESWNSNVVGQWILEGLTVSDGKVSIQKAEVKDAADQKNLEQFLEKAAGMNPTASAQSAAPTQAAPRYAARLSILIPKFLFEKEKAGKAISKDQYTKYQAAMDLLAEIVGDKDINHVTDRDVELVQETLQMVPKHRNNTLLYKGKTLAQAIELAEQHQKPRLDVSTVDFTLQKISGFFEWARKKKHLEGVNPFQGSTILSRRERKKKSPRTQFTLGDLQTIFNPSSYLTIKSPSLYWLPLLSAYSGARMNELAQLDVADVTQVKGVWSVFINDDKPDKRLKSDAARRYLPIHSVVLALGFLDYVAEMREAGHRLLFPNLKPSSKGLYSYMPSKEFAAYLDKVGIQGSGTVFHSFRHTAMDTMKQNDVDIEMRCELAGQEHDNVNSEFYTNKARIGLKAEALERIQYEDLDLEALKYRPGQFKDFIKKTLEKRQARLEKAAQCTAAKMEAAHKARLSS